MKTLNKLSNGNIVTAKQFVVCPRCTRYHVPNETPDLIAVNALDDYKLALEFADGKKGVFDCLPYMQFEFMEGLRDPLKFAAVSIDHGTVAWPEGEDLCPDDLYANAR